MDTFEKVASLVFSAAALIVSLLGYIKSRKDTLNITYNLVEESYFSMSNARNSLAATEQFFPGYTAYTERMTEEKRMEFAEIYKKEFHDAQHGTEKFRLCREARDWLDKLEFWGKQLVDKKIDKTILFNVIGPALEIDYPALSFITEGHRLAHPGKVLYANIGSLKEKYDSWKQTQGEPGSKPIRDQAPIFSIRENEDG